MTTAIIVIVVVLAILVGVIMNLRSTSKAGMPPPDVLKRATERARVLDQQEKAEVAADTRDR